MSVNFWNKIENIVLKIPDVGSDFLLIHFFIVAPIIFIIFWMNNSFEQSCSKKQILSSLLTGALCVIPVAGIVVMLDDLGFNPQSLMGQTFFRAFVTAAAVEELVKLLGMGLILIVTKLYKSPRAVIFMATGVGLGFATVENIMYVAEEGLSTAIVRSFTAVPCHACLGAIAGYYISKYSVERQMLDLICAIAVPILLHGMYDLPLMASIMGSTQTGSSSTLLLALFTLTLLIFWTRYVVVGMSRYSLNKQ